MLECFLLGSGSNKTHDVPLRFLPDILDQIKSVVFKFVLINFASISGHAFFLRPDSTIEYQEMVVD